MAAKKRSSVGRLVDPKTLKKKAKKRRESKYEPIVRTMLKNRKKAYVFEVPKGKAASTYRGMLYPRIKKALDVVRPKHNLRATIAILENGNLAIQLVKAA